MSIEISHIPPKPWVYLFKNKSGKILYVGKAKNLAKRVWQYFTPWSVWKQDMLTKAHHVDFIEVRTESEALYLEDNLIKTNDPEYNRLLKWDNSYIYLKITNEDFPQLYLTRRRKNDWSTYIGPKTNIRDLYKLMHYLRQIYQYRTMKKTEFSQGTLSSDFYFGLDKWRSIINQLSRHPDWTPAQRKDFLENDNNNQQYTWKIRQAINNWFIITKSYSEYKYEYRQIVRSIVNFFEGNTKEVKHKILKDIENAIDQEHFERCINLKKILHQIDIRTEKQSVVLKPSYTWTIVQFTSLEDFWVIIIIQLYEGKIIDVIREKKKKDERTLNQMISSLEKDLNIELIENTNTSDHNHIYYSSTLKKLLKKERKEIYDLFEKFTQSYIASTTFHHEDNLTEDLLKSLQTRYHLNHFPYQIECIDISHFSGMDVSGWLACMREWILYKPWYRRYKIKALEDNKSNYSNDFLSLQEIIVRRFDLTDKKKKNNQDATYPDLFVIDGGKWQLSILYELFEVFPSLQEIKKHHTSFVALGEWSARQESSKARGSHETVYYFDEQDIIQEQDLVYDPADKLLTKLRDEAHRFANTYRKKRMSKPWKTN